MYKWFKKIHMYAGLLTFTALLVWGITGIEAVFLPAPGGFSPPEISSTREVAFEAPGGLDDRELAKQIFEAIKIPLSGGHYGVTRDDDANLSFLVFTWNGRRDVTYLEGEGKVRIAHRKNSFGSYLSSLHAAHSRRGPKDWPARVWGIYNEVSLWAFSFMTLSGVYLWAITRPRLRWAQLMLGVMVGVSVVLWWVTR